MGWFSKADDGFFLATIPPNGESVRVERVLGVVNGEAIIGANIFRDMFSSIRDVVGGRAGGYERSLSGARNAPLADMKEAAKELGAEPAFLEVENPPKSAPPRRAGALPSGRVGFNGRSGGVKRVVRIARVRSPDTTGPARVGGGWCRRASG